MVGVDDVGGGISRCNPLVSVCVKEVEGGRGW